MPTATSPTLATLAALGSHTSIPTAGRYFGLSRPHAYELHQQGRFPVEVRQVGARYVVLVSDLARALGLDPRWLLEPPAPAGADD